MHSIETWLDLKEPDTPVRVHFETSPPEPDVNWPGGLDIISVETLDGVAVETTAEQDQEIIAAVEEQLADFDDAGAREDYEYEQWKDRQEDGR